MIDDEVGWEGWIVLAGVVGVAVLGLLFTVMVIGSGMEGAAVRVTGGGAPPFVLRRLAIGLGSASVMMLAAAYLIRTTEWDS